MKRKTLLSLCLIAIMTVLFAITVSAADPVEAWDISATENDSVTAYLYADPVNEGKYTLTISGTGNMAGWGWNSAPWHASYRLTISSVTIEGGVTSVGQYAFTQCDGIESITIGSNVVTLGHGAFQGCGGVKEINFNATRLNGFSDSHYVFEYTGVNTDGITVNIGNKVEIIPSNLFHVKDPTKLNLKTVVFEANSSCTIIDKSAFCNCFSLKSVTLPTSLTTIEHGAFYQTGLDSIVILENVTYIGPCAFEGCGSLKSVTLPQGLKTLGYSAFRYCRALEQVAFNATLMDDMGEDNHAFEYAGENTSGLTFKVGKNVARIPARLFNTVGCNLKAIVFEANSSCTTIGTDAFCNSSNLKAVTLPKSITTLERGVFYNTGLEKIIIPVSVTSIGMYVFEYCTELTIYTELASQPSTWHAEWNKSSCPVVWDYKTTLRDNIFTFKGYSFNEAGQIAFGFDVDIESKTAYEELTGKKLEIGALFASYDYLGGKQPLDNSGKETTLNTGKVVKHNLSDYEYLYYDFILTDISDELKGVKLVISAYVCNGEETKYEQENGMSDTVTGISYNKAKESKVA